MKRKKISVGIFPCLAVIAFFLVGQNLSFAEIVLVHPDEAKPLTLTPPETQRNDTVFRFYIVSLNDFHGNFRERNISIGAAKFVSAFKNFKKNVPKDYPTVTLILCGGDNFSGTALSYYSLFDEETGKQKTDISPLDLFFNEIDVHASSIGNHAFDWGKQKPQTELNLSARDGNDFLEDHLARSRIEINGKSYKTYSSSNVIDRKTQKPPGGVPSYDLVFVPNYDFKIAVITLTTLETVRSTTAGAAAGYSFEKPAVAGKRIMDQVLDVDGFVVLAHLASYQAEDGTISFGRDTEDMLELVKLKPLAIISAHSHRFVAGTVDGVPIIQAGCHANGIASVDFLVDSKTKNIVPQTPQTIDLRPKRSELTPDVTMQNIVQDAEKSCNFSKVGTVRENMPSNRRKFTDIGTLICKALSTSFHNMTKNEPVLAVQHSGGIRSDFSKGDITEEDCYDMLPFQTGVDLCRLSGKNVIRLLREGFANPIGYLQCFGMTFYYDSPDAPKDQFVRATFRFKGEELPIDPHTDYWIVLDDFIVEGGDGFSKDIFAGGVVVRHGAFSRNVLARYCRDDLQGDVHIEDTDRPKFVVESETESKSDQ